MTALQLKCPRRNSCIEYGHCQDCGVSRYLEQTSGDAAEIYTEVARLIITEWILYNEARHLHTDHPRKMAHDLGIDLTKYAI